MIELQSRIIVLDGVLTERECQDAIEYYHAIDSAHEWGTFFPRHIYAEEYQALPIIEKIRSAVVAQTNVDMEIDYCQIVKWPLGSHCGPHFDIASPDTVFTSITYLNFDYTGGKTFIVDDTEFAPRIGRTICFDGNHYRHGVTEVTQGMRFTLPIWYKKIGDRN